MSRILVMPDAHLHLPLLVAIDAILHDRSYQVDAVVSLGDWCDDWDATLQDYYVFFDELMALLATSPVPWYLCWGNHDYGYAFDYPFSGKNPHAIRMVKARLLRLDKACGGLRAFYRDANTIFSHAGISQTAHARHPDHNFADLWLQDSPLWGRPRYATTDTYDPTVLQVVGHTPFATITHNPNTNMLYTDTWSDTPAHTPIGDRTLAIVDTVTQEWEVIG